MAPTLPADYPRIQQVSTFAELVNTSFDAGINALCWVRTLEGDFGQIASLLSDGCAEGVNSIDAAMLSQLRPTAEGARAVAALLGDLEALDELGLDTELNLVREYLRADLDAVVATDVYSFHADRAPLEVDTWLCTYHGAATEGLRNDEAIPHVQVARTRERLLALFGGVEGDAFEEFLRENSYDLHFAPNPGATPWSFGLGCLWRVAVSWPGSRVPPCLHRAPPDCARTTRLLLIG